ncbi:hypothetical protein E3N88_10315 [Mikania micrantha]|uniref:Transcription factor MYC/MYB N-terminal domain-containing protein n=1 Tax=Mikania micrantha TaxID=192012 RepID=A0A5N6PC93_9ASTR|nr:hypothetical protein E3N88_10315 [Mikania micrantha]
MVIAIEKLFSSGTVKEVFLIEPKETSETGKILVWEDGFCDVDECERARDDGTLKGAFGADVFFKLSHEVYNYGEGLVGKIAADNSHRWVFKDGLNEHDPSFISSWNASIDPQPKAWECHFNSGIKTIAIISVKEGIIQLGSFDKILEDLNLVLNIQRKFSYLRTIPGLFSIQRPLSDMQHPYNPLNHKTIIGSNEAQQITRSKVNIHDLDNHPHKGLIWSFGSGYMNPESLGVASNDPQFSPIPPLLPHKFGSHDHVACMRNYGFSPSLKYKISRVEDPNQEGKPRCVDPNPEPVIELGFGPKRIGQESNDRPTIGFAAHNLGPWVKPGRTPFAETKIIALCNWKLPPHGFELETSRRKTPSSNQLSDYESAVMGFSGLFTKGSEVMS